MQAVSLGWSCLSWPGSRLGSGQDGFRRLSGPVHRGPSSPRKVRRQFAPWPVRRRAGPFLRRGALRRGAGAAPSAPDGACRRADPVRSDAWRLRVVGVPVNGGVGRPERLVGVPGRRRSDVGCRRNCQGNEARFWWSWRPGEASGCAWQARAVPLTHLAWAAGCGTRM